MAWACDVNGQVYFRSGDNGPPTFLAPAWIAVDEVDIAFKEVEFKKWELYIEDIKLIIIL
jgi:hypothetical protein